MICVGIDIAKGKSTVCFLKPGGEVLKTPYDMEHTAEGITKLIRDIRSYDEEVRVVLEATGHYHLPVVAQLLEANVFVCVVNALRMKKFCSQDIRKAKTDRIDAAKIAAFGLTYWQELKQTKPTDEVYRELRLLSRQYFQLTSMLVKANLLRKVNRFFENNSTKFQGNGRSTKRAKTDKIFRPRGIRLYVIMLLIHGRVQ